MNKQLQIPTHDQEHPRFRKQNRNKKQTKTNNNNYNYNYNYKGVIKGKTAIFDTNYSHKITEEK